MKTFFGVLLSVFILSSAAFASGDSAEEIFSRIPVQHGGRIKPFQSFAQETVLYVTGKQRFEGRPAVSLVLAWLARPEQWGNQPLIPVGFASLKQELGPRVIDGRISTELILNHASFVGKAEDALSRRANKEKLSREEEKHIEIYERALFFRAIGEGRVPGWVPHPEDPERGWFPLSALADPASDFFRFYPAQEIESLRIELAGFLASYRASAGSAEPAGTLAASLNRLLQSRGIVLDQANIDREIRYLHLQPFGWAWKLYLVAALLFLIPFLRKTPAGLLIFLAGFAVHTYGFYLRSMIAGRPPVTNMYESIIWVSWAVAFFSIILYFFFRSAFFPVTAALVGSFALLLAGGLPTVLDPSITPLVPVLRSNLWLTVHVLTITLSYGAFALAWGLGHAVVYQFALHPEKKDAQMALSNYLYRTVQIGVILLAAGTILGGVWASFSWGRFWGWDPKETWALIALLGYLSVLHGRFAGWIGPFGMAVGCVIAFLGVLMAWYGVNFVLAAGLHSYGFGGGGLNYVAAGVALDLLILAGLAWLYKTKTLLTSSSNRD